MIYNIFQFQDTNLWGCTSPKGTIIYPASRRQCIAAATRDALEHKTSCTIISEIIRP